MQPKKGRTNKQIQRIIRFLEKCKHDNVPALAGQSAFFLILSAVPFMMFAFSLVSTLFGETPVTPPVPEIEGEQYTVIRYIFQFLKDSVERSDSGTTVISAIAALWSAGKGLYCITDGISRVYGLPDKHLWVTKRIFSMGYTLVMLGILYLSVTVIAFNLYFADAITALAGGSVFVRMLLYFGFYIIFGVLIAIAITFALKLFLRTKVVSKRYASFRALFPGMALTVVAWNVLTVGVFIYIRRFAISSIYGSLGTVLILMMWIYFMMYLLLYGIQFNYMYREDFSRPKKEKNNDKKRKNA